VVSEIGSYRRRRIVSRLDGTFVSYRLHTLFLSKNVFNHSRCGRASPWSDSIRDNSVNEDSDRAGSEFGHKFVIK